MMGYSHTVSAAAGWLILAETGVVQVPDTPTLIVTTLACAGAGMLPDIDHHNGSIANSIPPLSRWLARVVGAISGGHRKGTHSLIGLIAFWAIAYFSIQLTYQAISVGATIPLIGDALTTRGILPLYPIILKPPVASALWKKSGYMALPLLGDAGSAREKGLVLLLTLYIGWYAAALGGLIPYPLQTAGLGIHQ